MKEKIIQEIDRRIKTISKNQKLTRGGYYKVELSGQMHSLEYLKNWITRLK